MNFNEVKEIINKPNISVADWADIQAISIKICNNFRVNPIKWPYQFQLMYNAWITECTILDAINTYSVLRNHINSKLTTFCNNNNLEVKQLASEYAFNDTPHNHDLFDESYQYKPGESKADITIVGNPDKTLVNKIEVKATTDRSNKDAYYDAYLVFECSLDKDQVLVLIQANNYDREHPLCKFTNSGDFMRRYRSECIKVWPREIDIKIPKVKIGWIN